MQNYTWEQVENAERIIDALLKIPEEKRQALVMMLNSVIDMIGTG